MNEIESTEIKQIEIEINFYKNQTVQSIFEIGERLIKAKELVEHGEWEEWLKNKVQFDNSQARRFMQVARDFPKRAMSHNLSQSKVFEMLALPSQEIESFIETNPVEDMTTRELRQAIKEKKELEKKIETLENQEPIVVEKEVEKIPDDYNYYRDTTEKLQDTVLKLNKSLMDNKLELNNLENQKSMLERKAKLNEEDSKKYGKLKDQIENLSKEKDDLGRQIKSRTELSSLVVKIEHTLKTDLAPIKYSRAIKEASQDKIVINNLKEIVDRVQEWCEEMYKYTGESQIIDMEVIEYD